MDELIKESLQDFNASSDILLIDGFIVFILSIILSTIIAKVYMMSHKGYSYIRSFPVAIILVSLTVSLIMLIIGSNIARAFALVGAMSIIRFRNPVKDTKDLVFIFASIAVGMACGTQFYSFAFLFVIFFGLLTYFLEVINFGQIERSKSIFKLSILENDHEKLEKIISNFSTNYNLLSSEKLDKENLYLVYEFNPKKNVKLNDLLISIKEKINIASFSVLIGDDSINS